MERSESGPRGGPRLVVIAGPTAAGKSRLALEIAEAAGAEVVSADSQQVYRGMDIGTGKISEGERRGIRHHLIDIVSPDDEMTAARFAALADAAIEDAALRRAPVVVAGGTGLYLRALLYGLFEGPPADFRLRAELEDRAEVGGTRVLWEDLERVDPELAKRVHPADRKRLIRALEVFQLTGVPMSEHQRRHDVTRVPARYPHRMVCLSPEREELYAAIDDRVDGMFEAGLVAEVETLRAAGFATRLRSQQAIGYQEVHRALDGDWDLVEARRLVKRNSRRYARRQLSWLRNQRSDDDTRWYRRPSEVDRRELTSYLRDPLEESGSGHG